MADALQRTLPAPADAMPTWEDARNLLCVRLDSLGDVLMTTPAIRALKEAPRT